MKTSFIILTFNKLEYTKKCIESIRKYTDSKAYEIIIVDNCSTDDTRDWLKQQVDIVTILNEENLGFPHGCNQGLKVATGDNLMLLNNDVIVTPHWLNQLLTALYSSSKVGAVGPVTNNASYGQAISVNYKDEEEMIEFARHYNCSNPNYWIKRLKLIGFCFLFKREVFEKVGYLDERFTPGNCEDDDYSMRIIREGYDLLLCYDTFIHHYGSVSFSSVSNGLFNLIHTNCNKFKQKWLVDPSCDYGIRYELLSFIQFIENQTSPKLLMIGCRCGGTILEIQRHFPKIRIDVIEENPHAALMVAKFANVISVDLNQIESLTKEEYDCIVIEEGIESLTDPTSILCKLKELLNKKGKLITYMDNKMYYKRVLNLLEGRMSLPLKGNEKKYYKSYNAYEINELFIRSTYEKVVITGVATEEVNQEGIDKLTKIIDDIEGISIDYFRYPGYIIMAMKED